MADSGNGGSSLGHVMMLGLLSGALHALSGPDHLATLLPLSIDKGIHAWRLGFRWGLGHSTGVGLMGLVGFFIRESVGAQMAAIGEPIVGLTLVLIGVYGILKSYRAEKLAKKVDAMSDDEESAVHNRHGHSHSHGDIANEMSVEFFCTGVLHGFVGTGHILGVLPAISQTSLLFSVSYLVAFGFGTCFSMAFYAGAVGGASQRLGEFDSSLPTKLSYLSSVFALGFGLVWLYSCF